MELSSTHSSKLRTGLTFVSPLRSLRSVLDSFSWFNSYSLAKRTSKMERVQLGSHSESEGPPPKLPPQPRPPSSSALKAKAAGLSIPIARYSAGQAALAWHESRSDKQSLTSLPSSTLALPNLQQTRGRVTKNATSGYVQVFEYNLPATRYPPHPEGALHIVDLTEYCKKEQCPADVAHARWVKDVRAFSLSPHSSLRGLG